MMKHRTSSFGASSCLTGIRRSNLSKPSGTLSCQINMKRIIICLIAALACVCPTFASSLLPNETLHYVITYKWGVVQKDAGQATLSLRNSGGKYHVTLTARTLPWADKVFQVRDTLRATIMANPFRPLRYEKITHEGGKYSRDIIEYSYSGSRTTARVNRLKVRNGKPKRSNRTFVATQEAFDMLSIFYYLRTIDYGRIAKGHSIRKIIFSGSKSETITIRNLGLQTIKLPSGKRVDTYHIRFNFTSEGGKKSSDDMDTWISASAPFIPYRLEGNLPVGKVKCYLK